MLGALNRSCRSMSDRLDPAYYRREAQLMRLKSDMEQDSTRASELRRLAAQFEQLAEALAYERGTPRQG
jgi:hypothetical protein